MADPRGCLAGHAARYFVDKVVEVVCVVAAELALVQCFAIRFLTNPKTIMQSQQTSVINRDSV